MGKKSENSESLPSGAAGLPVEISSFVGRERELAEVGNLLATTRLLTLVGPGGCGKTRLALRAARAAAANFRDGACWVELAPLSDCGLVPQAVASALNVRELPGRPLTGRLIEHLKLKNSLLVLDNCEHLPGACAAMAVSLLRACPHLTLLATSRESLGITGEVSWPVAPLTIPDPDNPVRADELRRYEAVRLFVERAKAVRPGFALADDNGQALAQVCCELDGIPLAIELAAVRVQALSISEIASRLTGVLGLLTSGERTARPRHRTLKATIDWSYQLLSTREQILFRRLSVFTGGFTLTSAEAVVAGEGIDSVEILDLLAQLVTKSMVMMQAGNGETRYRLLEIVRQYAREQLRAAQEELAPQRRHAEFFLSLAEQTEAAMAGPRQWETLASLHHEHANLRAALRWFMESGDAEHGLQLAGALLQFWWFRGFFTEGQRWLDEFLGLPGASARTAVRAKALHALGVLMYRSADDKTAHQETVRSRLQESIAIYRQLADHAGIAAALRELGRFSAEQGDWEQARSCLEESLEHDQRSGDARGIALTRATLGIAAVLQGADDQGRIYLEQALQVLHRLGGKNEIAACLLYLGCLACDRGDFAAARARYAEVMTGNPLHQYRWPIPFILLGYARLAASERHWRLAMRLAGAAESLRQAIGVSSGLAYRAYFERGLEPARQALGEEQGNKAWDEGRAMSLQQALAAIHKLQHAPARAAGVLSRRETEVLQLVAQGLSDRQVAEQLYISPRTVGQHLRSIYRKLGVSSRTAALRQAAARGLL